MVGIVLRLSTAVLSRWIPKIHCQKLTTQKGDIDHCQTVILQPVVIEVSILQ